MLEHNINYKIDFQLGIPQDVNEFKKEQLIRRPGRFENIQLVVWKREKQILTKYQVGLTWKGDQKRKKNTKVEEHRDEQANKFNGKVKEVKMNILIDLETMFAQANFQVLAGIRENLKFEQGGSQTMASKHNQGIIKFQKHGVFEGKYNFKPKSRKFIPRMAFGEIRKYENKKIRTSRRIYILKKSVQWINSTIYVEVDKGTVKISPLT